MNCFQRRLSGIAACFLLALTGQAARAQTSPLYDVPLLEDITLDGKTDDWGERGLRLDVLAPVNGGLRAASDFSATARLGWDKRGLLVRVRVRDNDFTEGKNLKELWERDSLELFWGVKQGVRDWVQIHVGPGVASDTPDVRVNVDDHRETKSLQALPVRPVIARVKTATGYDLEAVLPWDCLKITPQAGREIAAQIVINDVDRGADGQAGPRAQAMWFPEEGAYSDPAKMQRIRLSRSSSPPVRLAYLADYRNYPRTRLSVYAPGDLAGQQVSVRGGRPETVVGQTTFAAAPLVSDRGWAVAVLTLRGASRPNQPNVLQTANSTVPLALRDPKVLTETAIDAAPLRFDGYVFTGDALPLVDFENPERMEALLPGYTLSTTYYDSSYNPVTTASKTGRYGAVVTVRDGSGATRLTRTVTLYRAPGEPAWEAWQGEFRYPFPAEVGIAPQASDKQQATIAEYLKDRYYTDTERSPELAVLLAGLSEAGASDPSVQRLSAARRDNRWWWGLKEKLGTATQYPHLVQTPPGYDAKSGTKYPLLLFLHGSGERGSDLRLAATHGPLRYVRDGHTLPFLIVVPQCPSGERWQPARLGALLDEIAAKYPVDTKRVYLTGLSMGGFGTWELALEYPERFAAIAPICGGGDPADASRLTSLPVWNFHGAKDVMVPITLSEEMIAALKASGAKEVDFTIYPNAGHDAWTETYNNPALYEWLLKHSKQ